jgi:hypothetical protein
VSNYIKRRKARRDAQRASQYLAQTLRKNSELRYQLGRLRSDGWQERTPIWGIMPDILPKPSMPEDSVRRLRLEKLAYTSELQPEWCDLQLDEANEWLSRKAVQELARMLVTSGAVQRHHSFQYGEHGHQRLMWSVWVGVVA